MEAVKPIDLNKLIGEIRSTTNVEDKVKIARTYNAVGDTVLVNSAALDLDLSVKPSGVEVDIGDDCAVIPDGNGDHLLFASEGIVETFVKNDPWFAGYSAVMVNISDVCAMGGLPVAVTDVIWSKDAREAAPIWEGMKAASEKYNVPIVGGHTCYNSSNPVLSVSILGKAKKIIDSYTVNAGEELIMAVDLNGEYFKEYPFWNASTTADEERMRRTMNIPFMLANKGLCSAGKDISMGGLLGTLSMLLRTSGKGARVNLDAIPMGGYDLKRWLLAFPSYGFILAVNSENVSEVRDEFHKEDIACASIGKFTDDKELMINYRGQTVKF